MGSGELLLYELRGRRLRLLFRRRAVDFHSADGEVFRGGILARSYDDLNGDGVADVTLAGFVDGVRLDRVAGSRPFVEQFVWSPSRSTFLPFRR